MPPFRVVSSTMGVSSPASVADDAGAGGYRWRGHADWEPGSDAYREPVSRIPSDPGNQHRMGEKAERMRVFTEARERAVPLSVRDAGALVGIAYKTARGYERERLDALREAEQ